MNTETRIAVVGAGAIGGVAAAFISKAGWNLEAAAKHQETVDRGLSEGFHLFGVKGEAYVPVRTVKGIEELSGPKDVVLLATKANDCLDAARRLLPLLHPGSVVVSLQNGICEEALAEVLGRRRVVGCVVGWGATMHGPAEYEVTSGGEFVVGELAGPPGERLSLLQAVLGEAAPTRISENILGELYAKLIINACINSLGALTGLTLGRLLAEQKVRELFLVVMREAMAVADAMGLKVEPGGGGKLDFYRFLGRKGLAADLRRGLVLRAIGFKYRRIRSSSLQSLERGRKTEIDYLNGYICARGAALGTPTPLNDALVKMVKQIEEGKRAITPRNIHDPMLQLAGRRR